MLVYGILLPNLDEFSEKQPLTPLIAFSQKFMTKLLFIVAKICNVGRRITATTFHIRHLRKIPK